MHGVNVWRLAGSGSSSLLMAPGLTACAQLLERARAVATAAKALAADSGMSCWLPVGSSDATAAAAAYAAALAASSSSGSSSRGGSSNSSSGCVSSEGFSEPGSFARSPAGRGGGGAGGGGGGGGWRWSRWSRGTGAAPGGPGAASGRGWGPAAAAAAAAAAASTGVMTAGLLAASALADSPSPSLEEARSAAQLTLNAAWAEVEEEFARLNARLPSNTPSLKGDMPTVSEVHGAVEVVVPIRTGADPSAVLKELRQGLGGRGSTSYSESMYGASRTVRMEIREPGGGVLRVMMFVPPSGGSEQAQVVVSKRSPFSPEELEALRRVVRAANVSFGLDQPARSSSGRRHGLHGSTDAEAQARAMDELFESFARDALRGFMAGPMQHIFEELQRGIAGGYTHQGAPDEGEESPGPFGGFGGSFGGLGGGSGGFGGPEGAGGFPGLPAPPAVQHRPKGHGSSSAQGHDWGSPAAARAVEQLLAMGAQVFPPGSKDKMDWGVLAGYDEQKRTIEDCLLLPLLRPDVYTKLARATRKTFANNRPRAVLFEGPPGTGKTTSARVISSQAAVPLIYLPLEAVLSKWYGQSEQQLGAVFKAAEAMGGAIIFLDELDALGGNREAGGLHEVSRRLLSVLLREMEGFDAETKRTVVIGATNRKTDLDPALLSRFDLLITFGLPDTACRKLILRQYAQQLSDSELGQLAERTPGMSGRDLRDVCEHTERRWASKIIRGEVPEDELPPLSEYLASADERATAVQSVQQQASAAGAINRLLGAASGGRSLPSWLTGGQQ